MFAIMLVDVQMSADNSEFVRPIRMDVCVHGAVPPLPACRASPQQQEQNSDAVVRCTLMMARKEGDKRLADDVHGEIAQSSHA